MTRTLPDAAATAVAHVRRPYPAYRDSGVEWLGEVPVHWQVKRVGTISTVIDPQPDHRAPALARGTGFPYIGIRDLNPDGTVNTESARKVEEEAIINQEQRFTIAPGDIVFCKVGTLGYPKHIRPSSRIALSATLVLIKPTAGTSTSFLRYALDSSPVRWQIDLMASGTTRPALGIEHIRKFQIHFPPLDEQRAIAAYLDRETAHLDALVAKKQRLIELLREKRAALISHAVTRGLDPNAPMKDSGIPWHWKIPAHWEVKRLKHLSVLQTGLTLGKDYGKQLLVERPYLRVANVQDGFLDLSEITNTGVPRNEISRYELQRGDVLMTEGGDSDKLGRGCVWNNQIVGCLHQNHIFAIRPAKERLLSRYLTLLISSYHGRTYFTYTSKQTTNLASTNSTTLGNFPLLLPPINEQQDILAYLDAATAKLDILIVKVREHMDNMREYRAALIAAAVTGKIDVRS